MRRRHRFPSTKSVAQILLWSLGGVLALLFLILVLKSHNDYRQTTSGFTPKDFEVHGIDISHHQGQVDFGKVKNATVFGHHFQFIFAKCTEGRTRVDHNYERNRREAHNNGFYFGAYHFFVPGRSAKDQADNFIRNSHLQKGDFVPALDVEKMGKLSKKELNRDILRWLQIVGEHYHCRPILYTYHDFHQKQLQNDSINDYPLWKALYLNSASIPDKEWTFFQYTRHGHVAGIRDGQQDFVDLDVFVGSPEDLKALTLGDF